MRDPDIKYEFVTAKEAVEVPEWARDIRIGDTISWTYTDECNGENEVVGFSLKQEHRGLPCIDAHKADIEIPDDAPEGMTIVVQESEFEGVVSDVH